MGIKDSWVLGADLKKRDVEHNLCKVRLANFLLIKSTLFWMEINCYFFGHPGSKVALSCRSSNPGPSDSQPDAMAVCHGNPIRI